MVEPNESTHLLAEQDGAYARVPKDKVGGSGGGVMWVDVSVTSGGAFKCSHTGAEILAAMNEGTLVFAKMENGGTSASIGPATFGAWITNLGTGAGETRPFFSQIMVDGVGGSVATTWMSVAHDSTNMSVSSSNT